MDTSSLISLIVTAVLAVSVPWQTFRLALRQEQSRWLREQRYELYTDLLTEMQAEERWLKHAMADERARTLAPLEDLRLPAADLARLASRSAAIGGTRVNRLFGELNRIGLQARLLVPNPSQTDRALVLMEVDKIARALERAIRDEMGTDGIASARRLRKRTPSVLPGRPNLP